MDDIYTACPEARVNKIAEPGWIAAARGGDPWALEQFYACYQSHIYLLCHRMLGSAEDAEDAVQAAFVRGFRSLAKFRGECSLKTWIYRIAVNEALTILRKRRNAPVCAEDFEAATGAEDNLAERIAVHAALARVKPDHRAILILRFWEELSYEEIAEVLSLPLSTVRMRIKRARDEFQKWYEHDC